MPIYTKTGDRGETSLANMQRVSKASPRLEAYGTADELNAWVGLLRAQLSTLNAQRSTLYSQPSTLNPQLSTHHSQLSTHHSQLSTLNAQLQWAQNRLFNIGAALSLAEGEWVKEEDVLQLEQWIDAMQAELPPMRCFILPAGSESIATAHVCRTVTRRLERLVVALQETTENKSADDICLRFINRLSDYFFTLARYIAHLSDIPDTPWER
ncbi:MAG: cob(I)yrinic acid a,c-diamide adenosyltransferase [Paludibacteraceae bacterium]